MRKNRTKGMESTKLRRWHIELRRKPLVYQAYRPRKKIKGKTVFDIIHAPDVLCIYNVESGVQEGVDAYKETISFIEKIKSLGPGKYKISFCNTRRLSVAAALLIYASIDKIMNQEGITISVLSSLINSSVNYYLKATGIKGRTSNTLKLSAFKEEGILPVVRGSGGDYRDEIVDYIRDTIYKNDLSPELEYRYGDAVQETINNVRLHAYPDFDETKDKVWWLYCDVIKGELFLAIFDQGVGIPNTVVDHGWFQNSLKKQYPDRYDEIENEIDFSISDRIKGFFSKSTMDDDKLIHVSMLGDLSSTKEDKHGQGSKSIKALVSKTERGNLWVYSNSGLYNYQNNHAKVKTTLLPASIKGTLVQWNIKL